MYYPPIIWIDTHAKTNSLFAIEWQSGEVARTRLGSDYRDILGWIEGLPLEGPYKAFYESGPTGFGLARYLNAAGVACEVCAASKVPKGDKRKKNDRRDAEALGRQGVAGTLRSVYVPTPREQTLRDLSHHRAQCSKDLKAAKQRVTSYMLAHDIRYTEGRKPWTKAFSEWAGSLPFDDEVDAWVFHDKIAEVERLMERKKAVTGRIEEAVAKDEGLRSGMARLCAVNGIGLVTAFTLVSEVNDFTRFSNGGALAAYLGLIPSEDSSGDKHSCGRITKQGNPRIRSCLIECVGVRRGARPKPGVILGCAVDPKAASLARRCGERMERRRTALAAKGKSPNKVKVALARELAEWVYYIMTA
jgi:transposase